MNKSELISALAKACKISQVAAAKVLGALTDIIIKEVAHKCGVVRIVGFGTFKCVKVKARVVRNPRTGASMNIPARNKVKFIPSKNVQEAANKKGK